MKKSHILLVFFCILLASCGGSRAVKPAAKPKPSVASKPAPTSTKTTPPATSTPATTPNSQPSQPDDQIGDNSKKPGGYYLDDGPEANPPKNLDTVPDAVPKNEPLLPRSNKPYKALGKTYTPLSTSQNYKERGVASWYGKRFHGKKTSSGEIYDMYGMSAAHTILPLPSYAKVTNLANGRSVIVRVNDRGPFKSTRIIDLSYAAAYKLGLLAKGSGMVEVETINPNQASSYAQTSATNMPVDNVPIATPSAAPVAAQTNLIPSEPAAPAAKTVATEEAQAVQTSPTQPVSTPAPQAMPSVEIPQNEASVQEYFIQAGAFKSEANAANFLRKIQGLEIEQNAGINSVYNDGLHRVKLGPYSTKQEADLVAAKIRKQLNVTTIILTQ